ncbi:2519_t:CDS:2 [Entrophospora sp. SA101]|nr:2519_t:CDS:2 [Entrophospora sp. SA101]
MSCPKAVPTCEPVCNTGNETCIVTAKRCFSCPRAMCRSTKDESCLKCLMYPECKPCADDEMCVIEEPNCYSCGSATCVKKSLGCVYCTMMMPTCPPCHESYRCQIETLCNGNNKLKEFDLFGLEDWSEPINLILINTKGL